MPTDHMAGRSDPVHGVLAGANAVNVGYDSGAAGEGATWWAEVARFIKK